MRAIVPALNLYSALATAALLLHAVFILWVIFGALLVRARPMARWLHIASLIWGILIELLPWPCPLTVLENWLEAKAGIEPYQGGFLLHYLDQLVYPNISATALTVGGVFVCTLNLALYTRQMWSAVPARQNEQPKARWIGGGPPQPRQERRPRSQVRQAGNTRGPG